MKLATGLSELNMIQGNLSDNQGNLSDNLGSDCFDKISVRVNGNQNNEIALDNNNETNMEWTTVRAKSKRSRSNSAGSNDSEKINVGIMVSPIRNKNPQIIKLKWLPEMIAPEVRHDKVKVEQTKILKPY